MIIIMINFNYFLLYLFENPNLISVHIDILLIVVIPIVFMKILVAMALMNVVRKLMKNFVKMKNLIHYQFILNHSIIYLFML